MKYILFIVFAATLLSCSNEPTAETTTPAAVEETTVILTDEQITNAGIATDTMQIRAISTTLKLNGKIEVPPQSKISISVPLGGYLKSTPLLNGMYVKKGQVLATLQDVQYIQLQQDYLTAKAQFAVTEIEYYRQKELNTSKATSDKILEQTKANYQSQMIYIKSLEEKLKMIGLNPSQLTVNEISNSINIYSPIDGFVAAVHGNIGGYSNPGDVLFELVDPSDIHLNLTVFENDISKLKIGQRLMACTTSDPTKKYACEIILISRNMENNGSAQVQCHFDPYDPSLLPGMFMMADIALTDNQATVLPEAAVVRYANRTYAFVARDQHQFEMQEVQTGNTENGFTEILQRPSDGTTYVTQGAYNLLMTIKNKSE